MNGEQKLAHVGSHGSHAKYVFISQTNFTPNKDEPVPTLHLHVDWPHCHSATLP